MIVILGSNPYKSKEREERTEIIGLLVVAILCQRDVCCATRHVGLGRLPTIAHKTSARCGRATRDTPRRPSYKRKSYRSPLMQDGALLSLGAKAHGACAYFADIDVMPPHAICESCCAAHTTIASVLPWTHTHEPPCGLCSRRVPTLQDASSTLKTISPRVCMFALVI